MESPYCPCWNADNITEVLTGRMIYKDECCRCFATPLDKDGLDVCLRCFVGSCHSTDGGDNHSAVHFKNTEHPLVMNIKQVSKADGEPVKVTKLAIGKPGGIDADADKYDTITTVYCHKCDRHLDHTHEKVQPLVQSVLLAQSANMQSAVQEWELELKQCEHTLTLDQTGAKKIADKALAHCQECDLKSNLWLCLQCGHLGCGRKYHDGSGGNNHGVDHFKNTGHCVNVKIGTITPEGNASIHCYACDEEVLDENLAAHLGVIGIDIQAQVKTEKSIAEQELERNLNLTLSKIIEDGKTLIPLFGAGLTGMQNLGNSCYVNSVMQVMLSQPDFKKCFEADAAEHLATCTKFSPDCFSCQLKKLAHGLASGKYSQKKVAEKVVTETMTEAEKKEIMEKDEFFQDGVRPALFKALFGKGHPEFQTGQQQDAREYFLYMLDKIMKGQKANKGPNPGEIYKFQLEKRLQCTGCNRVKYLTQDENSLNVVAPVSSKVPKDTPVELAACLEAFFADSIVEGLSCNVCNAKTNFTQRYRFLSVPKVLCLVLQRFVYDDWVPKKLEIDFQVPDGGDVDLEKYRSTTNGSPAPGEETFPEANLEEEVEPELNPELLNMVIMMGIAENPAKHALYRTGNKNADMAVTWYFENMADESIQLPLRVKKATGSSGPGTQEVDPEKLMMLTSMGLPEKKCKKALLACDQNIERASDWVFSHMDDPDSDGDSVMANQEEAKDSNEFACSKPGVYQLQSFITHLGASVHAGHYVCHVKKDVDGQPTWVYFNDAKVAAMTEPPIGKGYLYFLQKK